MFIATLTLLHVLACLRLCNAVQPPPTLGVTYTNSTFQTVSLKSKSSPTPLYAWGSYNDSIKNDGWSKLYIYSNSTMPNLLQARAAGFLEGSLTVQRIWEYASNHKSQFSWSPKLREYVNANKIWMAENIAKHVNSSNTTTYNTADSIWWEQVQLMLEQQHGVFLGYNAHAPPAMQISEEFMLTMTMHSDMDTLCPLFGGCGPGPTTLDTPSRPPSAPHRMKDHCSVIVKLVPEKDELYVAHTTWTGYEDMTRVYKLYDLPYYYYKTQPPGSDTTTDSTDDTKRTIVPGRSISFSSYPGNVFSTDDWYTLSSNLVVTETTIDNHNLSLWKYVQPNSTLTWIRTMVANRLATNGPTWADSFEKHNSGTYNNEFHIVDYNVFHTSIQELRDSHNNTQRNSVDVFKKHLLTVVDQMPGHMEVADMTSALAEKGYWASYNRPGLPATYALANYSATVAEYGPHYSHTNSSRGLLFQLLHSKIVDEKSLKHVMRFNQFDDPEFMKQHENITNQMCANGPSASNAISERGDLTLMKSNCGEDVTRQNEGGIDMKYTTAMLMKSSNGLGSVAQSGPTYDDQPVFVWSTSPFMNISHVGQPDTWMFPYVLIDMSKDEAE